MYEPIKSLGQNFLVDKQLARDMVSALDIANGDIIVEIGPGLGSLTEILAESISGTNSELNAVEVDERFFGKLVSMYADEQNIKIINADILEWLPNFESPHDFKIIGSLPYYITSPIIHSIIKMKKRPAVCVLLVQKEVAGKIKSPAPDSSYMSCFIQTFFDVSYIGKVPKNRFRPEPEVDGGILKFVRKEGDFSPEFIVKYEAFLHKAFSNPRKMLNKMFTKEELEKGGIDPTLRAQNLNSSQWLEFYKVLNQGNS
ncbi:MAG: 16S rRNA (adenine(1518)-N(6)/adenine(1519)-N(6))-dimethyltransferase RsmA [Patescibacteria group bacterium]|nr:ribosomal RNA small subunit methyltransferase A [Patescibacteria group bacterium]MBU1952682.1 ribosomal RNA small subunit methyltransferase A [Patescibacteria group bacterium]